MGFFVLYLITVKRWTASGVSYQFVLWPLVAVAVSAWLEGEQVSWTLVLGGAIVIAGVYVGALMQSGARSSEGADAQDLQRPRPEAKV